MERRNWPLEAVEDGGEGLGDRIRFAAGQLHQSHKQGGAFHQHADLGAVGFPDDQVSLPVAGNQAGVDLAGTLVDQRHLRHRRLLRSWLAALRSAGVMSAGASAPANWSAAVPAAWRRRCCRSSHKKDAPDRAYGPVCAPSGPGSSPGGEKRPPGRHRGVPTASLPGTRGLAANRCARRSAWRPS